MIMAIGIVIKALNHPIRRDIIEQLKNGPISAGDLAKSYSVSKPTMSTHFAALKDADLIEMERQGNNIYYRLNVTVMEETIAFLVGLLSSAGDNITALDIVKISSKSTKL